MNAPTQSITGDLEIDLNLSVFHRLRSEMLDSFADVEQAICKFISDHQVKGFCATAPMGHKVELAKSVKAGPQRSKAIKAATDQALTELEKLLLVRADMVHSRMSVAITTEGQFIAIFRNSKNAHNGYAESLVLSERELGRFVADLSKMSNKVTAALNATNPPPVRNADAVKQPPATPPQTAQPAAR